MEAGENKDSPTELFEMLITKIASMFSIKAMDKFRKAIEADDPK